MRSHLARSPIYSCLYLALIFFVSPPDVWSQVAGYPAHWWEVVAEADAASWEVLPQHAGPGQVVLSKRNELGILSNFAATPFRLRGKTYASVEGFWQMMKYPEGPDDPRHSPLVEWRLTREDVAGMVGFEAKRAGDLASQNMKKLGINWVTFEGRQMRYRSSKKGAHYSLIINAMWAKLKQNPDVKKTLLRTGDLELIPDHNQGVNPPPAWQYHKIWMKIRSVLAQRREAR